MMARPLLSLAVVAACLAMASATSNELYEMVDILEGDKLGRAVVFQLFHAREDSIDQVTQKYADSDENLRRVLIAQDPLNASTGVLLGSNANFEASTDYTTMDARKCWQDCRDLYVSELKYRFHFWATGPVRNEIEAQHIVETINRIWRTDKKFWPATEAEKTNSYGADPVPTENAIWIGMYGDAGQGNQSLPFTLTSAFKYSQWELNVDEISVSNNKYMYTSTGPELWIPSSSVAPSFYEWIPFQSGPFDWSYEDWADGFPVLGGITVGTSAKRPRACVKMVAGTEIETNGPYAGKYHNGKWENTYCTGSSLEAGTTASQCFCRAICSIQEAILCHQSRVCSADGTIIETNYEYNYTSCKCEPKEQKRCCTECDEVKTGGRIVPTECRYMVPGDRDYAQAPEIPDEAPFRPTREDMMGWPACRRILFGPNNPKNPIFVGGASQTTAADFHQQGSKRRDLPEF